MMTRLQGGVMIFGRLLLALIFLFNTVFFESTVLAKSRPQKQIPSLFARIQTYHQLFGVMKPVSSPEDREFFEFMDSMVSHKKKLPKIRISKKFITIDGLSKRIRILSLKKMKFSYKGRVWTLDKNKNFKQNSISMIKAWFPPKVAKRGNLFELFVPQAQAATWLDDLGSGDKNRMNRVQENAESFAKMALTYTMVALIAIGLVVKAVSGAAVTLTELAIYGIGVVSVLAFSSVAFGAENAMAPVSLKCASENNGQQELILQRGGETKTFTGVEHSDPNIRAMLVDVQRICVEGGKELRQFKTGAAEIRAKLNDSDKGSGSPKSADTVE